MLMGGYCDHIWLIAINFFFLHMLFLTHDLPNHMSQRKYCLSKEDEEWNERKKKRNNQKFIDTSDRPDFQCSMN